MTDKYYGIYFDRHDLTVDEGGHLTNPEALQIIEFEYDEATDEVIAIRRCDRDGNVIEAEWQDLQYAESLTHTGEDDDQTIEEALSRFYEWLIRHTEWRVIYPENRWQPAEYICIGIEGCVEE